MSGSRKIPIIRSNSAAEMDELADEVPVIIRSLEGDVLANMLATPFQLDDLARGHIISEELGKIENLEIEDYTVIVEGNFRERSIVSTSTASCGACSTEDIANIMEVENFPSHGVFEWSKIHAAMNKMRSMQKLFKKTGGTHAAALYSDDFFILREDIGRHNALDKVIGATSDYSDKALLLSSRGGVELIAKACRIGIGLVACQGAISAAAADLARSTGMTLIAFCRAGEGVIIGDNSRIVRGND